MVDILLEGEARDQWLELHFSIEHLMRLRGVGSEIRMLVILWFLTLSRRALFFYCGHMCCVVVIMCVEAESLGQALEDVALHLPMEVMCVKSQT